MTIMFIDVSLHDRNRRGRPLDWNAIEASGLGSIMMARVSYGDPNTFNPPSPYARELIQGAKSAGYPCRIGYHNLIHGDQASINRQVDYLRRTLDVTGATSGMADIERYEELVANGLWPRWTDVRHFHDRWYAVDSRPMVWYIPRWLWSGHLGQPDLRVLRGPLTNSNYPDGDGSASTIYRAAGGDNGPGWGSYGHRVPEVWQFTSNGNVPGNNNQTDCNAFKGTAASFMRMVGVSGPTPAPTPPSSPIPPVVLDPPANGGFLL